MYQPSTCLLTSKQSSRYIIEHHKRTQTSTIQIVDELKNGSCFDPVVRPEMVYEAYLTSQ